MSKCNFIINPPNLIIEPSVPNSKSFGTNDEI